MKFWWFKFEGWFADDSGEYPGQGVFSECLVQNDNYVDSEFGFISALAIRKINLIEIEEHFLIDTDPREMDPENPDNDFWIEWCNETESEGSATFEVFNLYPADEVNRTNLRGN